MNGFNSTYFDLGWVLRVVELHGKRVALHGLTLKDLVVRSLTNAVEEDLPAVPKEFSRLARSTKAQKHKARPIVEKRSRIRNPSGIRER